MKSSKLKNSLGGGIGYLNRQYGLTCDNLLAVDLVTAEGKFIKASAYHETRPRLPIAMCHFATSSPAIPTIPLTCGRVSNGSETIGRRCIPILPAALT